MKKFRIFGFVAFVTLLAFALILGACDGAGSGDERYEDLIIRGSIDGRATELVISTNRTVPRNILDPATGDSYVLRFVDNGQVISQGTISRNGVHLTFRPTGGGEEFRATYYGGNTIQNLRVPLADGTTASFTPSAQTSNTGGGGRTQNDDNNGQGSGITVSVSPGGGTTPHEVAIGKKQEAFHATVVGHDTDDSVTWSIETNAQKHADTSIDQNGLLDVDDDQVETTLIIRATSVEDPTKYGTATVLIVDKDTLIGAVTITVAGSDDARFGRLLTAEYTPDGSPGTGEKDLPNTGAVWVWRRNGVDIANTNSTTYTPVAADVGAVLTAAVSHSDLAGEVSDDTDTILARTLVGTPTITGDIKVGETLQAGFTDSTQTVNAWQLNAPADGRTFSWRVDGAQVATGTSYVVKVEDAGKKIVLRLTTTGTDGHVDSAESVDVVNINCICGTPEKTDDCVDHTDCANDCDETDGGSACTCTGGGDGTGTGACGYINCTCKCECAA